MSLSVKKIFIACVFEFGLLASLFAQSEKPDALKLYRNKKYAEAIAVCEKEIKADPKNMDAYSILCWSLISNDQYNEAEQRALEARKINSYDTRLIYALGEARYFLGKNNEALSMFQRFIANASESSKDIGFVYFFTGEIYIRQSKFQHADIALTAAVHFDDKKDNWWTRLGYAREMAGDYKNAIVAYDKALALNPSQYDATRGKNRCQSKI